MSFKKFTLIDKTAKSNIGHWAFRSHSTLVDAALELIRVLLTVT